MLPSFGIVYMSQLFHGVNFGNMKPRSCINHITDRFNASDCFTCDFIPKSPHVWYQPHLVVKYGPVVYHLHVVKKTSHRDRNNLYRYCKSRGTCPIYMIIQPNGTLRLELVS